MTRACLVPQGSRAPRDQRGPPIDLGSQGTLDSRDPRGCQVSQVKGVIQAHLPYCLRRVLEGRSGSLVSLVDQDLKGTKAHRDIQDRAVCLEREVRKESKE